MLSHNFTPFCPQHEHFVTTEYTGAIFMLHLPTLCHIKRVMNHPSGLVKKYSRQIAHAAVNSSAKFCSRAQHVEHASRALSHHSLKCSVFNRSLLLTFFWTLHFAISDFGVCDTINVSQTWLSSVSHSALSQQTHRDSRGIYVM